MAFHEGCHRLWNSPMNDYSGESSLTICTVPQSALHELYPYATGGSWEDTPHTAAYKFHSFDPSLLEVTHFGYFRTIPSHLKFKRRSAETT